MRHLAIRPLRGALAAALLLAVGLLPGSAQAQTKTPPAATAYRGPRFPGGPDSLQAALARLLRPASPALAGQVVVRLELNSTGQPQKATVLPPSGDTPAATLARTAQVQELARQVPERLPLWQLDPTRLDLGPPSSAAVALAGTAFVLLTFGPQPTAPALSYSETTPVFPAQLRGRSHSDSYFFTDIISFLQRQIRYPAQDLRNQVQGTIYAYLEVSETGAVEQRHVVSGLSPTLNEEVERVLRVLPPTLTPPHQGGRPVRVGYVLPLNLRIQ